MFLDVSANLPEESEHAARKLVQIQSTLAFEFEGVVLWSLGAPKQIRHFVMTAVRCFFRLSDSLAASAFPSVQVTRLGRETFVSFDKQAVALLTARGQLARLL